MWPASSRGTVAVAGRSTRSLAFIGGVVTSADALEFPSSLDERQFIDLVQAACERRREERTFEGGEFSIDAFSLSISAFRKFRGELDPNPYTRLCAVPAPEVAHLEWAAGLCQSGQCEECHALIESVAKLATCPVCHRRVECT